MSERRVIKCNVYMYINSSCQGDPGGSRGSHFICVSLLFLIWFCFVCAFSLLLFIIYCCRSSCWLRWCVFFVFLFLFLRRLLLRWRLLRLGRSTRSRVVGRWSRRSLLQRVGRLHRLVPVDHRVEIAFYHHNYRFVIIIIKNFFGWWGFFFFVLRTKWKRKTKW